MLKKIFRPSHWVYRPLNRVEISASSLLHNYHYLLKKSGQQIFPVLKSNAYGHGIVPVAQVLDTLRVPYFCVDSLYEAYQLMTGKITTPILIMGYVHPHSLGVKKLPFSYAVYGYEMIEAIAKYQPHAKIHIFVDTGMHREGVPLHELQLFTKKCRSLHLKIEGLISHLAMADKPDNPDTRIQVTNFLEAKKILKSEGIIPRWVHLGASSYILNSKKYPHEIGNVARVGIALYGVDPENKDKVLKPALKLVTTISQIKELKKGDKVGYDFTHTAKKNQTAAVLPIGYNDGVNRRLSSKGSVLVKGIFCPLVGRISMNLCAIDVTKVKDIAVGDEATIYSSNPNHMNSIAHSAQICDTIPYELLVYLNTSTKRVLTD